MNYYRGPQPRPDNRFLFGAPLLGGFVGGLIGGGLGASFARPRRPYYPYPYPPPMYYPYPGTVGPYNYGGYGNPYNY